jgi:hypothetical protein
LQETVHGVGSALGQVMAPAAASCVSVYVLASSRLGSDKNCVNFQGGLASVFSSPYLAATGCRN